MLVYVCISGHGFGHGSRQGAILSELHKIKPDWRIVVSTPLSNRFLKLSMGGIPFEKRVCYWDVGVVQPSAIEADNIATSTAVETLEFNLPIQVDCERRWLQSQKEQVLIISDIPPAAVELAKSLNVPLIWIGNFGWDDIYSYMGKCFKDKVKRISNQYCQGTYSIRLPFSMAMDWNLPETQVGLTTSPPRLHFPKLIQAMGWSKVPRVEQTILIGFGGLKLNDINYQVFEHWNKYHFLVSGITKNNLPYQWPNNVSLLPSDLRPLDVMPLCRRMITKPGYSSFCEALSQGLGLHVVNREGFAEVEVLERGLKAAGYYRFLSSSQFWSGEWELEYPLNHPSHYDIPLDGAIQVAYIIINLIKDY